MICRFCLFLHLMLSLKLCDVPPIFCYPAEDHVSDWYSRILLRMVEAVNGKNTRHNIHTFGMEYVWRKIELPQDDDCSKQM